jgi:hypothetical protein
MKKIALLVFTLSLRLAKFLAESPKTHEFKNGELIIYSKNTKAKSVPAKVGTIDKENQRFTIPVDSRLDAFTSNDLIWDDYSSEDFSLYVEKDYIQSNQILIPKGSIFSGHAHHRSNRRVDFNIDYLELPNGKKYYISAEARNPNGKDYVQAQYIRQNSSGKKIASRTFDLQLEACWVGL